MTLVEALKTNKPATHPTMIGAFMWIEELKGVVHRDYIPDFRDRSWIISNCRPTPVMWLSWEQIIDDNWNVVNLED